MLEDLRYALRLAARQKAFSAAAVATLALGIGANVTVFSIVYGVLLRPLPYANADRIVRLSEAHPGGTPVVRRPLVTNVTFHAWRRQRQTIERIAAYSNTTLTLLDRGASIRVPASSVTPELFDLLGARPLAGRLLQEQDARPDAPRVAVLSAGLWQSQFGEQPSAIGRSLVLGGEPYLIVGVAPRDFYFPDREVQVWIPLAVAETPATQRLTFISALALLRRGATPDQAAAEGTAAARSTVPRHFSATLLLGTGGAPVIVARPLIREVTATVRPALIVLFVSVGLILLMTCANVANLLLSRGISRRRELALRVAIGAGQGRLARQLLIEVLVLSTAGGVVGLAVGWALTRAIPALAPANFPRLEDIHLDAVALGFAVVLSTAAGILAGILPAWRDARTGGVVALREGVGASTSGRARFLGSGLLAAEAAFAVMLVITAGLLGRSFVRLVSVDAGYDAGNVLMASVHLEGEDDAGDRAMAFVDTLLTRIDALPGVAASGVSNMAPFVGMTAVAQMALRGDAGETLSVRALSYAVTPGYPRALSMRLKEGRLFDDRDTSTGIRPVLINEEFVRAYLRDGKPVIGRRFANINDDGRQLEIVGVVANVVKNGLDAKPQADIYSVLQGRSGLPPDLHIAVRTTGDPLALVPAFRQAVRDVDPTAGIEHVETLERRLSASVSEPRFAMTVLVAMASLALLLAAVGLYGVMSYQVSQRRREIGVRAALGASRSSIMGLVLREGVVVVVVGIGLGLLGAAWSVQLIQGLLFGIAPLDPFVFSAAPLTLIIVAVIATLVPARRAAAVDPIEALRSE